MRRLPLIVVMLLVLASCGSSEDEAAPTSSAPPTEAPVATTTEAPASTTTAAPGTTVAPVSTTSTTTTTIAPAPGMLGLTRVVFGPVPYVLIRNGGQSPIDLGDHWLCQRPSYARLPQQILEGGDTVAVGLGDEAPPELTGLAAVLQLGPELGTIDAAAGELGLYDAEDFGAASAMVDYVQWGAAGGGRESVAVEAGIWVAGVFVEVPAEALSISSSGQPGAGPDDWFADLGG